MLLLNYHQFSYKKRKCTILARKYGNIIRKIENWFKLEKNKWPSKKKDINGKDMEKKDEKYKSIYSRKTQGCVFQLFTVLLIKKISCHTELNFKRKFLLFLNVVKIKLEIF